MLVSIYTSTMDPIWDRMEYWIDHISSIIIFRGNPGIAMIPSMGSLSGDQGISWENLG